MKAAVVALLAVVGCSKHEGTNPFDPDASVEVGSDAAMTPPMDAPPKPKPHFTASSSIGGQLAITATGIRPTFTQGGQQYLSMVNLSLTAEGTTTSCGVTLGPAFVAFGSGHTSTRNFKTVVLDFPSSTMLQNQCGWDNTWVLQQLGVYFGNYSVGFAQARFAEDQPNVDVFLDAASGFGDTANIVYAGGGTAYAMADDGTVSDTVIQPAPGTLLPGAYLF